MLSWDSSDRFVSVVIIAVILGVIMGIIEENPLVGYSLRVNQFDDDGDGVFDDGNDEYDEHG